MQKPPQSWKDLGRDEKFHLLFLGLDAGLAGAPGLRLMLAKVGVDDWAITLIGVTILLVIGQLWRRSHVNRRSASEIGIPSQMNADERG